MEPTQQRPSQEQEPQELPPPPQQQQQQVDEQGQVQQQQQRPLLLLQLPREAIENVLLSMEPSDLVSAQRASVGLANGGSGAGDEDASSHGKSCTIPLAATCRTLHDLLLRGGGVEGRVPPLIHRIIANGLPGEAWARAALQCLPDGSDPRISLRLAATWARACRGVRSEHHPRPLALLPLLASTTDHTYEAIQQTVQPPTQLPFHRAGYWSSVSQKADTRDFLVYRLPGLCALSSVCIKAFKQMDVVYSWPHVRLHVFASLPSPEGDPALFRTAELAALDTSDYQEVAFARPVVGRYLLIELIGKHRQQHSETGWFVCVEHVTASGFQLLQAGPAVSPPPLPVACHTATLLRPAVRRVQVLGYSQERMLYGTTEIGAAASRFHPEHAPTPKFVSPDDIEFSAEGEAARVLIEEWLGQEVRAARTHKAAGSEAFQAGDFDGAIHGYTQALKSLWPGARTTIDGWTHRQASGLHWVHGAPALHKDSLAVTILSNCAESRLRAADQTATALRTREQVCRDRETQLHNGAGPGDEQQNAASALLLSPTALLKRHDEHLASALADAAAALDVGMDAGIRTDGNDISDKSFRRLAKAAGLIACSQAARLGDSIEPRSAEHISAGSLGGCADKMALEAAISRAWEVGAHLSPIEVEASCRRVDMPFIT